MQSSETYDAVDLGLQLVQQLGVFLYACHVLGLLGLSARGPSSALQLVVALA